MVGAEASVAPAMDRATLRERLGDVRDLLPIALPAFVLLVLALYRLTEKSLWFDEVFSVQMAQSGFLQLARTAAGGEANMVLYYSILKVWLFLGDGDAWVRLLSALFAVATVPVMFLLGRAIAGRAVGAVSAALFALSGFVVQYAQEARSYSLTMLLVSVALLAAVLAIREGSRRAWVLLVASSVLALHAHFFAGFTVLAIALGVMVASRQPGERAAPLRAFIAIGVLALPLSGQLGWVPPTSLAMLADTVAIILGTGVLAGRETPLSWALVAIMLGLVVVGAAPARKGAAEDRFGRGLLILAVVVPLGAAVLVSVVKPIFVPRFFAVVVPPMLVLAAAGIWRLRLPPVRIAALVVVGALAVQGLGAYYFEHPKTDWRSAIAYVAEQARPEDRIIVYEEWNHRAIRYYAAQHADGAFPTRVWRGLGASDTAKYVATLEGLLDGEVPAGARVWLVLVAGSRGTADPGHARFAPLRERYRMGPVERFYGLSVTRFDQALATALETAKAMSTPTR
jgi:mannosyltransferase